MQLMLHCNGERKGKSKTICWVVNVMNRKFYIVCLVIIPEDNFRNVVMRGSYRFTMDSN